MHTPGNKALFGALGDSAPDTWGRVLIRRAERQAALRFRLQGAEPFLAPSGPDAVPPLVELPRLLSSSERVTSGEADSRDLRLLLAPGSSMGGANTDDHLRNHGFLCRTAAGWALSPAYDLNPVLVDLAPRALTTAID